VSEQRTGDLGQLFSSVDASTVSQAGRPHGRKLGKVLRGAETLIYAVMCAAYEGYDELDRLYPHLESMFAVRLRRLTISPVDIDESIQYGLNEGLLEYSGNRLSLTDEGVSVLKEGRQSIMYEGKWMMWFLSRRNVVITSLILLVFMIVTKLVVGLSVGSHAMITDGLENTTDLIVIGIISASLRTGKDRLGATAIMLFMMVSGCLLGYNAIESLLSPSAVEVNYWAYVVTIVSLGIAKLMIWYKTLVGRMTGTLALISDAKETSNHIKIGMGVLIGLFFAEFGVYFVDSFVALLIAISIVWEGIEALRELAEAGETLSVDTIHLAASSQFDDIITHWVLARLARGPRTGEQLNEDFIKGVTIGFRYYDVHAIIGFAQLEEKGIWKHIQIAERSGLIKEKDKQLMITTNGLILYYRGRSAELRKVARKFSRSRSPLQAAGYALVGFAFLFILALYGESIYEGLMSFLRSLLTGLIP
jgi:divalent metal cation (Fe/Co/Zn/Cd) transporter